MFHSPASETMNRSMAASTKKPASRRNHVGEKGSEMTNGVFPTHRRQFFEVVCRIALAAVRQWPMANLSAIHCQVMAVSDRTDRNCAAISEAWPELWRYQQNTSIVISDPSLTPFLSS
jgi:hypothetical protein